MDTNRQTFPNDDSAIGARLTRVSRIDFNESSTGTRSLVAKHIEERGPRSIANLFGKKSPTQTRQLLDCDQIVFANQIRREFVLKVVSSVKNLLVNIPKLCDRFTSAVRSLLSSSYSTLSNPKFLCGRFIVPPVGNLRSVREGGEGLNTNIRPNRVAGYGQGFLGNGVARNHCVPFIPCALCDDFFDLSFDRSGQFDFQISDERKVKFIATEAIPLAVVDDRIEKGGALESRITRLFSILQPAKECAEGFVQLAQRLMQGSGLNSKIVGIQFANIFYLFALIEKGNAYSIHLPRIAPFLKRGVVEITQQIEGMVEAFPLFAVGIYAEFVSQSHG